MAQPRQVLPLPVDPDQDLVSLKRVQTVADVDWQAGQGLKLPRIAALNPWHLADAAAAGGDTTSGVCSATAAAEVAASSSTATRLPGAGLTGDGGCAAAGPGVCGPAGQVVLVREVLELPELGPEVQEKVAAAVAAWEALR